MVYIHGGGFFGGSAGPGVSGPEYFMDSGEVILVTVAYRLGPFGKFGISSTGKLLKILLHQASCPPTMLPCPETLA